MGLIDQAKADIQRITSNSDEFGVELTFTSPGSDVAVVNGLHTKHHLDVNMEGNIISGRNVHISVSEQLLTDESYPVRINGEVNLNGHIVSVKDSTEVAKTYRVKYWIPDETIGLILCILEVYG